MPGKVLPTNTQPVSCGLLLLPKLCVKTSFVPSGKPVNELRGATRISKVPANAAGFSFSAAVEVAGELLDGDVSELLLLPGSLLHDKTKQVHNKSKKKLVLRCLFIIVFLGGEMERASCRKVITFSVVPKFYSGIKGIFMVHE